MTLEFNRGPSLIVPVTSRLVPFFNSVFGSLSLIKKYEKLYNLLSNSQLRKLKQVKEKYIL